MKELPKEREILVVCHSGSRSIAAARKLNAAGYQPVNIRGGLIAWNHAGLPVKRGK
jgi:rhodanese-related sulfurtransferase